MESCKASMHGVLTQREDVTHNALVWLLAIGSSCLPVLLRGWCGYGWEGGSECGGGEGWGWSERGGGQARATQAVAVVSPQMRRGCSGRQRGWGAVEGGVGLEKEGGREGRGEKKNKDRVGPWGVWWGVEGEEQEPTLGVGA